MCFPVDVILLYNGYEINIDEKKKAGVFHLIFCFLFFAASSRPLSLETLDSVCLFYFCFMTFQHIFVMSGAVS